MAFFLAHTPNQVSKQARASVRLCFAELSAPERKNLFREVMRHTCYTMTELGTIWSRPPEQVLGLITKIDVCPEFDATEKARIVLAPHLGSWETLAQWLGQNKSSMFLYKRRENRALDKFICDCRSRTGGEAVPTKKRGLRKLLIGIREGRTLMILPDQRPGRNKAFIESTFFGFDAPTSTVVHNLCSKVECDVFIATMYRSTPVGEFGLRIEPLDYARLSGDEVESAAYMNGAIERLVRDYPGQYQWGYRRFKSTAYK